MQFSSVKYTHSVKQYISRDFSSCKTENVYPRLPLATTFPAFCFYDFDYFNATYGASQVSLVLKNLLAVQETQEMWVWSLDGPSSRKWQPTPVFLPGKFHGSQKSQTWLRNWVQCYIWVESYSICLSVTYVAWHEVFKVHLCYSMWQDFFSFLKAV